MLDSDGNRTGQSSESAFITLSNEIDFLYQAFEIYGLKSLRDS
jgi:hypothetical protein